MNEIFASILSSVTENEGLGFTKIMYNCYLSYGQVTRFLQFANENDFLAYDNNTEIVQNNRQRTTIFRTVWQDG
jgi:predicted transcriptional regulator